VGAPTHSFCTDSPILKHEQTGERKMLLFASKAARIMSAVKILQNLDSVKLIVEKAGGVSISKIAKLYSNLKERLDNEESFKKEVDAKFKEVEDDVLSRFLKWFAPRMDSKFAGDPDYDWKSIYIIKEYGWKEAEKKIGKEKVAEIKTYFSALVDGMYDIKDTTVGMEESITEPDDDAIISVRAGMYRNLMGEKGAILYEKKRMIRDNIMETKNMLSTIRNVVSLVISFLVLNIGKIAIFKIKSSGLKNPIFRFATL
jgi:superfamily I DNA and/or RNA helicase